MPGFYRGHLPYNGCLTVSEMLVELKYKYLMLKRARPVLPRKSVLNQGRALASD